MRRIIVLILLFVFLCSPDNVLGFFSVMNHIHQVFGMNSTFKKNLQSHYIANTHHKKNHKNQRVNLTPNFYYKSDLPVSSYPNKAIVKQAGFVQGNFKTSDFHFGIFQPPRIV